MHSHDKNAYYPATPGNPIAGIGGCEAGRREILKALDRAPPGFAPLWLQATNIGSQHYEGKS